MPTSNISLDIDSLISQANQIQLQNNIATGNNANTPETFNTRTSVFVTGKDPQSTVKKATSIPQITEVDILKDSLDNPFVSINFQCQKADIDSGKYVYFNVYKVNLPSNQIQIQALQP